MHLPDMFAHKLCALLDRKVLTSRDIFDCHFLMQNRIPLNKEIVEKRMKTDLADYLQRCIDTVEKMNEKRILSGLDDLMGLGSKGPEPVEGSLSKGACRRESVIFPSRKAAKDAQSTQRNQYL